MLVSFVDEYLKYIFHMLPPNYESLDLTMNEGRAVFIRLHNTFYMAVDYYSSVHDFAANETTRPVHSQVAII